MSCSDWDFRQPEPKSAKKTFGLLQSHFIYLRPRSKNSQFKQGGGDEFIGEYQSLMEQEFFDFVMYEVPWIVN
jgi:V-type H+-transporting ATPase subunit C